MQSFRAAGLVIAILVLPATAWAACRDRDLEGTYDLTAQTKGGSGTLTLACEVGVTGAGELRPGTTCAQRSSDGLEASARVEGGRIAVTESCEVSGRIVIGGFESEVTEAQMSGDKARIAGEGRNVLDRTFVAFSATRRVTEVTKEAEEAEEAEAVERPAERAEAPAESAEREAQVAEQPAKATEREEPRRRFKRTQRKRRWWRRFWN